MKALEKTKIFFASLVILGTVFSFASAQTATPTNSSDFPCGAGFVNQNGICVPQSSGGTTGSFVASKSLTEFLGLVIKFLLTLAGVIAVVLIIVGGYWYIASGGNEEQAEKGRRTLTNAIIGLVVVVLAYTLVTIIVNGLTSKY